MASSFAKLLRLGSGRSQLAAMGRFVPQNITPIRTKVCTETGALLNKPDTVKFGLVKVVGTVTPFLLAGGYLSREFASLLEEHELFVPDDDDDD